MVLVGSFHVAQVPITVGSGLLVGRGVVMVLRLGLQRLLVLASWMTYFLSLVTHLGLVGPLVDGSLRMWCCSTNFSSKKPSWKFAAPLEAGSRDSGDTPNFRGSGEGGRKRIRLTKKTNIRKRFWG